MKKRVRGAAAVGCTLLVSLLGVGSASAADPRQPYPNPTGSFDLNGYCSGFDVVASYTRSKEYVIHQTTAPDGTITQKITGSAVISLTNATTGKTVTYNASGPGTVIIYPDNSYSVDATGPTLFWTLPQNSYLGVPTISYTRGPVSFYVDATGMTTSYSHDGHQINVCDVLAS